MIDRKALKIGEQVDRLVASGADIANEGMILVEALEAGVSKVSVKATVDGSEIVAGVSLLPYSLPATSVNMEQFTIPSSGSLIFSLRAGSLVTLSSRAAVVGGSDLTVSESSFSSTPSTGNVKVDIVGGRVKFAAGDAGKVVNFIYRYSLSVAQARVLFQERSINNRDLVGNLGQVGIAKGYVEFSTDQYDSSKDYSTVNASTPLTLGNNGIITIGGSGGALPSAKVLALPDLSGSLQGPMLRVSMLIG